MRPLLFVQLLFINLLIVMLPQKVTAEQDSSDESPDEVKVVDGRKYIRVPPTTEPPVTTFPYPDSSSSSPSSAEVTQKGQSAKRFIVTDQVLYPASGPISQYVPYQSPRLVGNRLNQLPNRVQSQPIQFNPLRPPVVYDLVSQEPGSGDEVEEEELGPDIESLADEYEDGIPEWALLKMSKIKSVNEFVNTFLTDADSLFHDTLESKFVNDDPIRNLAAADDKNLKIASPGGCDPVKTVIEFKPEREGLMYFPSCIKMERCSGCCRSERMECRPTRKTKMFINVLQVEFVRQAKMFARRPAKTFPVERHDSCACQCKITPTYCKSKGLKFNAFECGCVCLNAEKKKEQCDALNGSSPGSEPRFKWDAARCACVCRNEAAQCSNTKIWNGITCQCEARAVDRSVNEIDRRSIAAQTVSKLEDNSLVTRLLDTSPGERKEMDTISETGINPHQQH